MILGLHHLSINSKNVKAALHFYHDILGWEITRIIPGEASDAYYVHVPGTPGEAVPCGLCELEWTDQHGKQCKVKYGPTETGLDHIAVRVDDPEPLYKKLVAEGCDICMPLQRLDVFGHYTFGVLDPDGVKVEFIAPYTPVPQTKGE